MVRLAVLPLALALAGTSAWGLEQYTPDKASWNVELPEKYADHSPDGFDPSGDWEEWDGTTIYNPEDYSKKDFANLICPHPYKIRGLRKLFYKVNPFNELGNPTKSEVDEWHRVAVNHVRAMIGYTNEIRPDKCLHLRALWADEKKHTKKWDDVSYSTFTCEGHQNAHCGGGFIPSPEDQQPYLPAGITSCKKKAGSEGMFWAHDYYPWSVKFSGALCSTLKQEGFWGGHTGPWFHRSTFGWSFYPQKGLRAKWGGTRIESKYINPDIAAGKWLVNFKEPRFPGFECEKVKWIANFKPGNATDCYNRVMAEPDCGKRFVTYNTRSCACYPPDMETCNAKAVAQRLTWDMNPVPTSVAGFKLPEEKLHSGKECQEIRWKTTTGSAFACLQNIMSIKDGSCGYSYLTWNSVNGGCACYAPGQTTCKAKRVGGRETYAINFEPALGEDPAVVDPSIAWAAYVGTSAGSRVVSVTPVVAAFIGMTVWLI